MHIETMPITFKYKETQEMVKEALLDLAARCGALPDVDTRTPEEILGFVTNDDFSATDLDCRHV